MYTRDLLDKVKPQILKKDVGGTNLKYRTKQQNIIPYLFMITFRCTQKNALTGQIQDENWKTSFQIILEVAVEVK